MPSLRTQLQLLKSTEGINNTVSTEELGHIIFNIDKEGTKDLRAKVDP